MIFAVNTVFAVLNGVLIKVKINITVFNNALEKGNFLIPTNDFDFILNCL